MASSIKPKSMSTGKHRKLLLIHDLQAIIKIRKILINLKRQHKHSVNLVNRRVIETNQFTQATTLYVKRSIHLKKLHEHLLGMNGDNLLNYRKAMKYATAPFTVENNKFVLLPSFAAELKRIQKRLINAPARFNMGSYPDSILKKTIKAKANVLNNLKDHNKDLLYLTFNEVLELVIKREKALRNAIKQCK